MKLRRYLVGFIAIAYTISFFTLDYWKDRLYHGDSSGYYTHVVSFFVNKDVGDYDKTITTMLEYSPNSLDARTDKFGIRKTEIGRYYIKYTLGVPIMEIPGFLIAHFLATINDEYDADGWSLPYMFCVNFSILFFVILGINFLIKILQRYFDDRTVALTTLSIALATNLLYQATYTTMSHGFLFFDFCLLIYVTIKFYEAPNKRKAFGLGILVGLIAITRVPEVVSAIVPLLWGVYNINTLKKRILFIQEHIGLLLPASVGFIIIFSPQLLYWYYVSGQPIFNPYQGEGFDFLSPDILNGWFNCSNGWLVYTPIMSLSLVGWFLLRKKAIKARSVILVFVGLNSWIHYSYYVWNYYPGLGSRPMVESYPLLAFGLAAFFAFCFNQIKIKWLPYFLFLFFTWLNIFQTWQLKKGIIWTERSNQAFFWSTFGTLTPTIESLRAYDSKEHQPDTSKLSFIQTIHFEDFEDTTLIGISDQIKFSGQFALFDPVAHPNCKTEFILKDFDVQPKDWIYVGLKGYRRNQDMVWNRDSLESLEIKIVDDKDRKKDIANIKIAAHIGNDDFSIWKSGVPDQWGEAGFFIKIPKSAEGNWTLKAYVKNPNLEKLFIDDFHLEHYRKK